MKILKFSFNFFSILCCDKFELNKFEDWFFSILIKPFFCVNFLNDIMIFFLKLKNCYLMLFIFLFSLNEMEIPLITLFKDGVLKSYQRLIY